MSTAIWVEGPSTANASTRGNPVGWGDAIPTPAVPYLNSTLVTIVRTPVPEGRPGLMCRNPTFGPLPAQ